MEYYITDEKNYFNATKNDILLYPILFDFFRNTIEKFLSKHNSDHTFNSNIEKINLIYRNHKKISHKDLDLNQTQHYKDNTQNFINCYSSSYTYKENHSKLKKVIEDNKISNKNMFSKIKKNSTYSFISELQSKIDKVNKENSNDFLKDNISKYTYDDTLRRINIVNKHINDFLLTENFICSVIETHEKKLLVIYDEDDDYIDKNVNIKNITPNFLGDYFKKIKNLILLSLDYFIKKRNVTSTLIVENNEQDTFINLQKSITLLSNEIKTTDIESLNIFNDIKKEILTLDKQQIEQQEQFSLFQLKNNITVVLPKLFSLYNDITDKNLLNGRNLTPEQALQKSMNSILSDIKEIKSTFSNKKQIDLEIFSNFLETKHSKNKL